MSMREEFEKWFEGYAPFAPEHLDDCAFAAWKAAYLAGAKAMQEEAAKKRSGKPRELKPCGTGAFLADQQYCFDKGHKEGARAVRDAIRAINPENLLAVE